MTIYLCRNGHLVRADSSQVSIDSICGQCKRIASRRANRETARRAFAKSLFDMVPASSRRKA